MERNIEDTQLKGLTPKLLWSGLIAWSTLLISIIGSYYNIKAEFQQQDKTNALFQVQIDALKVQISTLESEVQTLSIDVANNKSNIGILKIEVEKSRR